MSAATLQRAEANDQLSAAKIDTLPGFCLEAIVRHNKTNTVSEKRGGEWLRVSSDDFALDGVHSLASHRLLETAVAVA